MSGLSASTYSCGGEGSLLGLGGVFSLGSSAGFWSTLWKNFRMPCRSSNWMSDSTSEGGSDRDEIEDSSEESSPAILDTVYTCCGRWVFAETGARHARVGGGGKMRSARWKEIGSQKLRTRSTMAQGSSSLPLQGPGELDRSQGPEQQIHYEYCTPRYVLCTSCLPSPESPPPDMLPAPPSKAPCQPVPSPLLSPPAILPDGGPTTAESIAPPRKASLTVLSKRLRRALSR